MINDHLESSDDPYYVQNHVINSFKPGILFMGHKQTV